MFENDTINLRLVSKFNFDFRRKESEDEKRFMFYLLKNSFIMITTVATITNKRHNNQINKTNIIKNKRKWNIPIQNNNIYIEVRESPSKLDTVQDTCIANTCIAFVYVVFFVFFWRSFGGLPGIAQFANHFSRIRPQSVQLCDDIFHSWFNIV